MIDQLPNLLIAGVPKAGTTSLFSWLADHPQAVGSYEKETYFFADPESHTFRKAFNASLGLGAYAKAFAETPADTHVVFEASPGYIYSRTALAQVPDLPSNPRVLFVLRDPASQIRSVYGYFRDNWNYIPADMSFDAYLQAVAEGGHDFGGNELAAHALAYANYRPWLDAWQNRLGPDRMKVCTFDRLQADPASFMADIALWCGIDPTFYQDYSFPRENETYVPKIRTLQRVNVALRSHLPKGRIYKAARRAYRSLNTHEPAVAPDESAALDKLRHDFATANLQLAEAYDLDLSGWLPQAGAEGSAS